MSQITLLEIVRKQQLREAVKHQGKIDLDLDQEGLQQLRESS